MEGFQDLKRKQDIRQNGCTLIFLISSFTPVKQKKTKSIFENQIVETYDLAFDQSQILALTLDSSLISIAR